MIWYSMDNFIKGIIISGYVDLAKSKALESYVEMLKGAKNILNSFLG